MPTGKNLVKQTACNHIICPHELQIVESHLIQAARMVSHPLGEQISPQALIRGCVIYCMEELILSICPSLMSDISQPCRIPAFLQLLEQLFFAVLSSRAFNIGNELTRPSLPESMYLLSVYPHPPYSSFAYLPFTSGTSQMLNSVSVDFVSCWG